METVGSLVGVQLKINSSGVQARVSEFFHPCLTVEIKILMQTQGSLP